MVLGVSSLLVHLAELHQADLSLSLAAHTHALADVDLSDHGGSSHIQPVRILSQVRVRHPVRGWFIESIWINKRLSLNTSAYNPNPQSTRQIQAVQQPIHSLKKDFGRCQAPFWRSTWEIIHPVCRTWSVSWGFPPGSTCVMFTSIILNVSKNASFSFLWICQSCCSNLPVNWYFLPKHGNIEGNPRLLLPQGLHRFPVNLPLLWAFAAKKINISKSLTAGHL